jgi:HD-GYP domain-containing protein (c-di-GMP phosphodiesterase class II)
MSAVTDLPFQAVFPPAEADCHGEIAPLAAILRRTFGMPFSFWSRGTGELSHAALQPGSNDPLRGQLARALAGCDPQFIQDEDSLLVMAIPLALSTGEVVVATAAFVTRVPTPGESLAGPAQLLGLSEEKTAVWMGRQSCWTPEALHRLALAVQAQIAAEVRGKKLEREVEKLSDNLATTYEEICLLHGLTQNLRISADDEHLCRLVLDWLLDCLPAQSIAIQLLPVAREGENTYKARTESTLLNSGACPLNNQQFTEFIEQLQLNAGCGPRVMNHRTADGEDWIFPGIRQLIVVSIAEGDHVFGWLAAFNHRDGSEFGTVEASLLNSVGAMVGIHAGNRDLYREQSEFLASVVRALTSAIDAKDPYTCGHSDRVARVSVRLAKELGCDPATLHTLYMAGLLHDIGKIGIDDAVLRKPGKLTDEEFNQIKQHPELGYRILADIRQFAGVLPAVLHHHEQWDGGGYPFKLTGDQTPRIARIVAVADAYDAMSSDRPYRKGMDSGRVDEVLRQGAGQQWDPEVVAAFFAARPDITAMSAQERANLTLDVQQWV